MSKARTLIPILLGTCLLCLLGWLAEPPESIVLPSAIHNRHDVQYFAPGPDFPLANEEAAVVDGLEI